MIKPKIFENIAVYYIQSDADRDSFYKLQAYFEKNKSIIKSYNVNTIMLSFLNVDKYDVSALKFLLSTLQEIAIELDIFISIMEYKKELYLKFLEIAPSYGVSLFKSFEIAKVFFDILTPPENTKVVILDKNIKVARKISQFLEEKGCKTIAVDSDRDFKSIASKEMNRFLISSTYVNFVDILISAKIIQDIPIYNSGLRLDKKSNILFNRSKLKNILDTGYKNIVFDLKDLQSISDDGVEFLIDLNFEIRSSGANLVLTNIDNKIITKSIFEQLKSSGVKFVKRLDDIIKPTQKAKKKADISQLKKSLVANIPLILDTLYDTFSLVTTKEIEKVSHKISAFDIEDDDIIASLVSLRGELKGSVVVAFSTKTTEQITSFFTKKSSLELSFVSDAIRKVFVNLVDVFKKNNININASKPISYNNIDVLSDILGTRGGILVILKIDNEPLYIFVTSVVDELF